MRPTIGFDVAWAVWAISWLIAALWSAHAVKRQSFAAALGYRIPVIIGALFLFHRTAEVAGTKRLFPVSFTGAWTLVGIAAAGFLFTWWARIHLGTLWSGSVTLKADHHVVDTGPYGVVRHPIYTGLLIATLATALALATWPALIGFALIALGIWQKARMEERFLREELGTKAYDSYAAKVPMLVPFI